MLSLRHEGVVLALRFDVVFENFKFYFILIILYF
jgi:hypothetical protein